MKTKNTTLLFALFSVLFALMMSLPFLVPHLGFLALTGLIPLLMMDRIATLTGARHFWMWHYFSFVLWNAVTTFWVCNATVGGGLFASAWRRRGYEPLQQVGGLAGKGVVVGHGCLFVSVCVIAAQRCGKPLCASFLSLSIRCCSGLAWPAAWLSQQSYSIFRGQPSGPRAFRPI